MLWVRFRAESDLHDKYAEKCLHGEWFALDDDDVAWIMSIDRL
ncbi:MAG: GIY-YIG nuclease family protein [Actinomycetia bacterium]|nr:GIY-YIG nuclease family protein [Actinomycetes bacterium]